LAQALGLRAPEPQLVSAPVPTDSSSTGRRQGSSPPAVVHLLFLLRDRLPHAAVWARFLADAPSGTWAAWCHCTDHAACEQGGQGTLNSFRVHLVPWVPSAWGIDLVSPEVAILREALSPNRTEPVGRPRIEKFVIVSDATLPIKPFHEVYSSLAAKDKSDFCFSDRWSFARVGEVTYALPRHQQWVVLTRAVAEKLVSSWSPISEMHQWSVPLPTGQVVPRSLFQGKDDYNSPADMDAPYALGVGPVDMSMQPQDLPWRWSSRMPGQCRTYAIFPSGVAGDLKRSAWSTHPHTVLTASLIKDPEVRAQDPARGSFTKCIHPMVFVRLGARALQEMRRSPYLFLRKFDPELALPADYGEILFAGGGR